MSLKNVWKNRIERLAKTRSQNADVEHWLITEYDRSHDAVRATFKVRNGEPACIIVTDEPPGSRITWVAWKDGRGMPFQCPQCAEHWRNYAQGLIREVTAGYK